MKDLVALLDSMVGKFVLDDGGIYKGQCPQLIKWLIEIMGCDWTGKTGNGSEVIDTMVNNYGGYYGENKYGYRIVSAKVKGNNDGHCWIEVNYNGKWIYYQQNCNINGAKSADFGCGKVYSITKSYDCPPDVYDIRYASHPSVDYYLEVHSKSPEPSPKPDSKYPDYFKEWVNNLADYLKNSVKE